MDIDIIDPTSGPTSLCEKCEYFNRGWHDTRFHPGESDDCGHPKYYALLTATMRRATIWKCKGFKGKGL